MIVPAIERREFPLWLSRDRLFPFLLQMWTMAPSLNFCERVSLEPSSSAVLVNWVYRTTQGVPEFFRGVPP